MKLTLIKEDIQDKNIVDEVMETHLYEDEKEKEAKEKEKQTDVANDKEVDSDETDSNAVQDILTTDTTIEPNDTEETINLDTNEEPMEIDNGSTETDINFNKPETDFTQMEAINTLNNIVNAYWGLIDQLRYIKVNDNIIKDESGKDSFNRIIDTLIDDTTISVGMIYKLLQLCDPQVSMLIDKGKNKADETMLNNN